MMWDENYVKMKNPKGQVTYILFKHVPEYLSQAHVLHEILPMNEEDKKKKKESINGFVYRLKELQEDINSFLRSFKNKLDDNDFIIIEDVQKALDSARVTLARYECEKTELKNKRSDVK